MNFDNDKLKKENEKLRLENYDLLEKNYNYIKSNQLLMDEKISFQIRNNEIEHISRELTNKNIILKKKIYLKFFK